MAMTDQQLADRLALIKEVANKRNLKAKTRKSRKSISQAVRNYSHNDKPNFNQYDGENINYWTDSEKYANEYYGETMRATTRFDNDWD